MTGRERAITLGVAALIAAFAATIATGVADELGRRSWFGNGANVIQWISGPATFAAVAVAVAGYLARTCAVPTCLRHGEHPVADTLKKVCDHHHTLEHHERVFRLHWADHVASGRLDRGESHR